MQISVDHRWKLFLKILNNFIDHKKFNLCNKNQPKINSNTNDSSIDNYMNDDTHNVSVNNTIPVFEQSHSICKN